MIKNFVRGIALILILGITSCKNNNPENLWLFTHTSGNANSIPGLNPSSFLFIQNDSTYTADMGSFEYGRWIKKDDQLLLTNQNKTTKTFGIKSVSTKEMQLVIDNNVTANFEAQPLPKTAKAPSPYSFENNTWRIKPKQKQTEEQLKNKLINHCKFWETYFAWAMENKIELIDVRSTPTPIKIYGNGFGLKPFNELPESWYTCFYDDDDCKVANNLLYEVFQYNDISWAHTDNKYKMFLAAFQQIQYFLLK